MLKNLVVFVVIFYFMSIMMCHNGHGDDEHPVIEEEGHGHSHSHGHSHDHSGHSHDHTAKTEKGKEKQGQKPPSDTAKTQKEAKRPPAHEHSHDHSDKQEKGKSDKAQHSTKKESLSELIKRVFSTWSNEIIVILKPYKSYDSFTLSMVSTAIIGFVPIIMLILLPINQNSQILKTLLAFAVGGLLGDVFLHLLPHSLPSHSHDHSHSHSVGEVLAADEVGLLVLGGMFLFFLLEKIATLRSSGGKHGHGHSHNHVDHSQERLKISSILNIISDFTHNITDGMAISASFLTSFNLGISTTIAVFFHEIPHEIGDLAILLQSGWSKTYVILIQILTASGSLFGAYIGSGAYNLIPTNWIIPFTAGGFIYISTANIIPELFNDTNLKQTFQEIIAMAFGVFLMIIITFIEEGH